MKMLLSPSGKLCRALALAFAGTLVLPLGSNAQPIDLTQQPRTPSLIITDDPLPSDIKDQVYSQPRKAPVIRPGQISGDAYFVPTETAVGQRVDDLQNELLSLQDNVVALAAELDSLQASGERYAADYYALIATVNTQLQSGTTPGNPRLERRMEEAQINLENLSQNLALLNQVAVEASNLASNAAFLQESVRSAYNLSGGIEEDHVHLAQLEDHVYNTIVIIERVLNNVNDDITRTSAYLSSERDNLRTLSVAVANGDLYTRSLSTRPFSRASQTDQANISSIDSAQNISLASTQTRPANPRPLVKIKFDRGDVNYEQAVYIAVSEALKKYPEADFELVAVHPTQGNAAKVAIETTRARRNAEKVLRSMTQIGLPAERVRLSTAQNDDARFNEVHLYVR